MRSTKGNRPKLGSIKYCGTIASFLAALIGCGSAEQVDEASEVTQTSSALIGSNAQIGVFRSGTWFLDANGDHGWSGLPADAVGSFGQAGDIPLANKNCNPLSQTRELFVTRQSFQWFSTANDFDWNGGDSAFTFGLSSGAMRPVMLQGHIAAVTPAPGGWLWDRDDSRTFGSPDLSFGYGADGNIAVAGRWSSSPTEGPGTFNNGWWIVDSNNNLQIDGADAQFGFGSSGDLPVVADFNVNHAGDEIAVFRNGTWFVDFNGNRSWDGEAGGDQLFFFGQAGDIPVVAPSWRGAMCIQ